MFQIGRMASPSELIPAFERDIRRIERLEKGTALNDAVVLEREKKQRREQQKQEEQVPQHKAPETEHPLHVYTSGATETNLDEDRSAIDVVA
jgi:hypothetical protein